MSMIFGYAFCNNKPTLILRGSKAVWYDDDGNRHVEEVKYIEADNWEQAKELIKRRGSEVAISKTETTTPVAVAENATTTQSRPEPLNMAECRSALEAIADSARTGSISTLPFAKLVLRTCEKALAAPPRNCDLPNIDERFNEVCHEGKYCCECKYDDQGTDCKAAWLLDTADESEAEK
jgi:hypothetical protein